MIDRIIFSELDVFESIKSFKPNKSPRIDKITSTYALSLKEILPKILKKLFNNSMSRNSIPLDCKKANVTPIFKKGNRGNVENYRPVSLTVIFGKVMEKIIKQKLDEFLKINNILVGSKHGFVKGKSCLTNLLVFQDSVYKKIDEGSAVDVIYLDLQKAFDKVPHAILMNKIREVGIVGELANWIENWLSNRTQRVVIDNQYSDWGKSS